MRFDQAERRTTTTDGTAPRRCSPRSTPPTARSPRTPATGGIFFGIITRQAIRRATFTSVPELVSAIRTFIDASNQRCEPFRWTETAD
jgi:hypothetical protein